MKIGICSDNHGHHHLLELAMADMYRSGVEMFIHCGDLTNIGKLADVSKNIKIIGESPIPHKIVIGGNHDFYLEHSPQFVKEMFSYVGVDYLDHSSVVIEGIKIFGSPYTPIFSNWAFMRNETQLEQLWSTIPDDTEILVTHGPPHGTLDRVVSGEHVGCKKLADRINNLKKLRLHCYGHIHEAAGIVQKGNKFFVNGSILNEKYQPHKQLCTIINYNADNIQLQVS